MSSVEFDARQEIGVVRGDRVCLLGGFVRNVAVSDVSAIHFSMGPGVTSAFAAITPLLMMK